MDNKFYIKRNTNNQIAKVDKVNILYLSENFSSEINETNLINILRQIEEIDLGSYFENSSFGKIPLSAKLVQKFTLCTLYVVETLQKDEFNQLPAQKKFEFIISQRTVAWINLLSKTEIVGFLEFCNIHSDISSTIVDLRNLAKAAIKSFREDGDLEESLNETDLTFTEENLPINLNCEQTSVNKTVDEENSKKNIDTGNIFSQLQNLLNELQTSNRVGDTSNNSNSTKYIQRLEVDKNTELIKQKLGNDLTIDRITLKAENNNYNSGEQNLNKNEDIDKFIKKFELISVVNEWDDKDKLIILQLYLKDSAEDFFEQLKLKNENITWNEVKNEFITEFTIVGNKHLLMAKLQNLKLMKGETYKEFIINITGICYKINKNMTEEEICEHILKGLPKETFQLIRLADNTSIASIKKTLEKLEVTNLLRSDDKVNCEVEKLTREMELLKNHISQIKIGQTQKRNNNFQNVGGANFNNGDTLYNRNQPYQPPIFNNPDQFYHNFPSPNFYPNYNHTTNNNQMTNAQFPRPTFNQNYNYNTSNNQLPNTQLPTQINQGTMPPTNYTYGNQYSPPTCFQCGMSGHIKRNCTRFLQKN
ncbi:hypothetical protein AGLY_017068 [Aphis glycines]|uniref:CCHC-type domain-containing protein n=1 Tax=Aphis glycines TaxID=307491 RepID=A0A6G0SW94_APHGL|nr:hypothetical protein AGLY_017068 [Aphis glycines]